MTVCTLSTNCGFLRSWCDCVIFRIGFNSCAWALIRTPLPHMRVFCVSTNQEARIHTNKVESKTKNGRISTNISPTWTALIRLKHLFYFSKKTAFLAENKLLLVGRVSLMMWLVAENNWAHNRLIPDMLDLVWRIF